MILTNQYVYVDAHCHLHEYSDSEVGELVKNTLIFAVSDDYESSKRTVELAEKVDNIIPGVGIHPWEVGVNVSMDEVNRVLDLIEKAKVKMIGEVGLDSRFRKETLNLQEKVFRELLEHASLDMLFNVHALGTWERVFKLLTDYNIKTAIFHWYSGPIELLKEIEAQGYYISINPSVEFQRKHREVAVRAPLNIILTESDGPYRYRGRLLGPRLIPLTLNILAKLKNLDVEEVASTIRNNVNTILRSIGVLT